MTPERLYSSLLSVYPKSFRERFRVEMMVAFAALRTRHRTSFRFWLFILADTCRAAGRQHFEICRMPPRRLALKWISLCLAGAIACEIAGSALTWSFGYLYHPYLEGLSLVPWAYGAILGAGLGAAQCVGLRRIPRARWIAVSAVTSALGFEVAVRVAAPAGPLGYGVVVGVSVAAGQWLVLRERVHSAGWLAVASATALCATVFSRTASLDDALTGLNPLQQRVAVLDASRGVDVLLRGLYAPSNSTEWILGFIVMAVTGLVVGTMTAKPISAMLSDPR
jgi:hypothetical protein